MPPALRHVATLAIVLSVHGIGRLLDQGVVSAFPFGHLLVGVLLCAALFDRGTGYVALGLAALLGAWSQLPPDGQPGMVATRDIAAVGVFVLVGATMTAVVEALHRAVADLQRMHDDLRHAERVRGVMLREFRHRTRNDLGSLVGLLLLRARAASSAAAREALRDAADHALALARVHARLSLDDGLDQGAERPVVNTRDFVAGLCADIEAAQAGGGLRPVRLAADAEAHALSAERAVALGLVLNETLTNALRYAFPEEHSGTVRVRFAREGSEFVLTVADDGIGLPPEGELEGAPPAAPAQGAGLGSRLLRALAAQLRGRFARHAGPCGRGTVAELRFAAAEPGT